MERRFDIAAQPTGPLRAVRDGAVHRLPARYRTDLWDRPFRARLSCLLKPGSAVLDVGAGRRPTVGPEERPIGTHYIGLDIDAAELAKADRVSYDDVVIAAAEDHVTALENRFDLVLSFFALEHVHSTARVLENLHAYLRPGGWLLAQLAGARSPFAVANRVLPGSVSKAVLARTQGRAPGTVFDGRYDRCSYSDLTVLLAGPWTRHTVVPLFTGAGYVLFSRLLTAAYIAYEEWIVRTDRRDLAPYYLVVAQR